MAFASWSDLVIYTTLIVFAVGALVLLIQAWVRRSNPPSCPRCGAVLVGEGAACNVCQAPLDPVGAEPHGHDARERGVVVVEDRLTRDPEVGVLNPGIRPWMYKAAVVAIFAGIGVRLLGMLEPMGIGVGISVGVMAALTVLGGAVAFLGFVLSDVA